jgi:pimeloyl-ACP methyl ester carboxylesterase
MSTIFNLTRVSLILLLAIGCTTLVPAMLPVPTSTAALPTDSISNDSYSTPTSNVLTQTLTVDNYQYVMECSGEGNLTVLLLGGRAANWKLVQEALNTSTCTCLFEHTGSHPTPVTATEIAKNVHTLLDDARMSGPYVLVGFSVGGYIVRLFADLFPDEVAGMTLLDSSHPDQNRRLLSALPIETQGDCQELKDYRLELQGSHILPIGPELTLDFDISAAQVCEIKTDLNNLPLVVLTAGHSDWPECFPSAAQEQLDKTWLDLQEELTSLSRNGTHLMAKESGHSFVEQPKMVIDAIQRVVQVVRQDTEFQKLPAQMIENEIFPRSLQLESISNLIERRNHA